MSTVTLLMFFVPLILLTIVSSLAFLVLLAIWLYRDARLHGQDPVLWVLICVFASPIIALILYLAFGRKQTMIPCGSCGQPVAHTARYCEHCGAANEQHGQPLPRHRMETSLKAALAAGAVSIVTMVLLMVTLFAGIAVTGSGSSRPANPSALPIRSSVTVNSGWVLMCMENHWDGVWSFSLNRSSEGYHLDSTFTLDDPAARTLVVQVECADGPLLLNISQAGQPVESIDLSQNREQPLRLPLAEYAAGGVDLQLVNQGATDISGSIWVE